MKARRLRCAECVRLAVLLPLCFALLVGAAAEDRRPRIYVYPEDPEMMKHRRFEELTVTFYGLDIVWYDMLKGSPYVVSDPATADFFYLPVYLYWRETPIHPDGVVEYLRAKGTWFDRKAGADHLFVFPGDFGRCEWGGWHELRNSILIHHFGKVFNGNIPSKNPCNPLKDWGDKCDMMLEQMQAMMDDRANGYKPCHYMGQDIVVPPTPWEHKNRTRYLNPSLDLPRDNLMFFAGPINIHAKGTHDHNPDEPWSDAFYSFGARQSFDRMFRNTSGVNIFEKHISDYFEQLSKAKFCLAAAGWGWGGRMKFAVMHGCIPVIVQDGVRVEFEEQMPMHEYALRIPMWYLHKLADTLEVLVRKGHAARMHKALSCVWRLHWWSRPHGRAFDLVMCELKRRAIAPKGKIVIDTQACTMECGDGKVVSILAENPV